MEKLTKNSGKQENSRKVGFCCNSKVNYPKDKHLKFLCFSTNYFIT